MELVERDAALLTFERQLAATHSGGGHLVLVSGEAGIGKTSLLKAMAARRGDATLWWGACDPLETPHPLAPLHDIARDADVPFRTLLQPGHARAELFESVLSTLQASRRPVLAIFEDLHWGDDATLDLLKFLGRRIDRVPCLLVMSWRDDEVSAAHPLRRLLGELPASQVSRLPLPPLSPAAVATLAQAAMRSATGLHALTHGNPLFVSEMLQHGTDGVPRGVQDLVLARFARLGAGAQAVVRLASTVPTRIEAALVDALLAPDAADARRVPELGAARGRRRRLRVPPRAGARRGRGVAVAADRARAARRRAARAGKPAMPTCRSRARAPRRAGGRPAGRGRRSPPRPRARRCSAARTRRPQRSTARRWRTATAAPRWASGWPPMPASAV